MMIKDAMAKAEARLHLSAGVVSAGETPTEQPQGREETSSGAGDEEKSSTGDEGKGVVEGKLPETEEEAVLPPGTKVTCWAYAPPPVYAPLENIPDDVSDSIVWYVSLRVSL